MKKRYITWEEVFAHLTKFENTLSPQDVVYGVPKGGMIASAFLSKRVPITYEPSKCTVILDDIIDSGQTKRHYQTNYPEVRFHGLFAKGTEWLVFPWEKEHPAGEDSVEQNIIRQLQYIGENPNRPGVIDTPKRVAKMWKELFRGYDPEQKPTVSLFKNGDDGLVYDQMIIDTGEFYSHCEHHMVPFFGRYWFGYVPDKQGAIIGLSKVARLVDYHAARLQIQERLVHDVVEDIWTQLSNGYIRPIGMGLIMEAEHLCKSMRGVKKKGKMTTTKLKGAFFDNPAVRNEFLQKTMNDK